MARWLKYINQTELQLLHKHKPYLLIKCVKVVNKIPESTYHPVMYVEGDDLSKLQCYFESVKIVIPRGYHSKIYMIGKGNKTIKINDEDYAYSVIKINKSFIDQCEFDKVDVGKRTNGIHKLTQLKVSALRRKTMYSDVRIHSY